MELSGGNNPENKNKDFSVETTKYINIKELHEFFIKFKFHGAKLSDAYIRRFNLNFNLLLQFKPDLELQDFSEEFIINFFVYLNTRKRKVGNEHISRIYKNSSILAVRSNLNVFFNWLLERNYIDINPLRKIPYPEVTYTDRRAFSSKEFDDICNALNTKIQWANLFVKKRNIAFIMVLVLTGVRKEEMLGLKLSDVDIDSKFIIVRGETSKSKRTRIIPMTKELIPYLEDYLLYRKEYLSNAFWVSSKNDEPFTEHGAKHLITLISKTTQINCHLHRFRHTFATNYYMQTHDLIGLKTLLGHKTLKMTISYLRSIPDAHVVEQMKKITIAEFL